jgi:hypothetical protein
MSIKAVRRLAMSGSKSKRKGSAGEREFADLIGGRRVPLSGALGGEYSNDVIAPNGWGIEIKRRATGFTTLYAWLLDEREKPDALAFRADRQPWVVAMTIDKFIEMLEAAKKSTG